MPKEMLGDWSREDTLEYMMAQCRKICRNANSVLADIERLSHEDC